MGGFAGHGIQKVRKYPLVDLMMGAFGQVHEANAALSGALGPTDLTSGFHSQAGESQLKAEANPLLRAQGSDGLHGHTLVIEVADDSAVGIVQRDVGQRALLMPVVGACLPLGQGWCLHTLRQEWFGQGLFGSILVSGGGGLAVTGLVRGRAGRLKSSQAPCFAPSRVSRTDRSDASKTFTTSKMVTAA